MTGPFAALEDEPRWVAWRQEPRSGKPTKVPYSPRGTGPASATDPATWGTRTEAERRARQWGHRQAGCGTGIVLGDIGGDVFLCGADLDSCIVDVVVDRDLADWAQNILAQLPTYAEISPSGLGIKVFFYIATNHVRPLLDRLGVDRDKWGLSRGLPGLSKSNHGPGIELYVAGRYFTVTGKAWPGHACPIALLEEDELEGLAAVIPPPSEARTGPGSTGDTGSAASTGDSSRSARALGAARKWYRSGASFEAMVAFLLNHPDPEISDWTATKGQAQGGRQLKNIWRTITKDHPGTEQNPQTGHVRFHSVHVKDVPLLVAPRCAVADLIPKEGLIVVWGPPKCGKSFWALDLAMHIALGRPYRGRQVEQGTVLYIAAEGEAGLRARVHAFRQARMDEGEEARAWLLMTRLDLVHELDLLMQNVAGELPDSDCAMIVVDTLNRTFSGSENRPEDMAEYIQAADRLREHFHCSVLLIHHCGINGERPRGHSSLTGAVDAQFAVKRDDDNTILVTLEWMKDGPEGAKLRARLEVLEVGTDDNGDPITSCVVEHLEGPAETERSKPSKGRLPDAQQIALSQLDEAIATAGERPPSSNHIPTGALCVREDLWRDYCYRGGISGTDNQDARQKAFRRAATALYARGLVGCFLPWVWPVLDSRTSGN